MGCNLFTLLRSLAPSASVKSCYALPTRTALPVFPGFARSCPADGGGFILISELGEFLLLQFSSLSPVSLLKARLTQRQGAEFFPSGSASGEIVQNNGGLVRLQGIATFCMQGNEATG